MIICKYFSIHSLSKRNCNFNNVSLYRQKKATLYEKCGFFPITYRIRSHYFQICLNDEQDETELTELTKYKISATPHRLQSNTK